MLLKNVLIENATETCDIRIDNRKFAEIEPALQPHQGEEVIDCKGRQALPPFVESHIHLDTCLSLPKTGENLSGTLFEGINLWSNFRGTITKQELKERATETIQLYVDNGVQHIRSHVDITSGNMSTFETLLELKEELKDIIDIQLIAFPQDGIFSSKDAREKLNEAIKLGADGIGAIPHFEFTREYGVESLDYIINLAEKSGKLVDVHCDEIDDEQSRFIEVLAARAYESGLGERITASHATAMHSYNSAYCSKLFRLLRMSNINIVSNPLVNVNLQGRFDTFPKRRGITRVKELLENDINVSFGHDDILDPFYPLGNGDMRDPLIMGLHLCHMMGHNELMNSYKIVTYNGAKTLNLGEDYGIKVGNTASLIILDAPDFITSLRKKAPVMYSIRHGKFIKQLNNN